MYPKEGLQRLHASSAYTAWRIFEPVKYLDSLLTYPWLTYASEEF